MAKQLNRTDGFILHGWMVTDLHLAGGELVAYALVHQFTQSNAGKYLGGPGYLAAWIGCGENTARKYLHNLVAKGLILNEDKVVNGVLFRHYRINATPLQNLQYPCNNCSTPLQNLEVENNKDNTPSNEGINTIIPPTPKKFDFRQALVGLGVSQEVADAWMQVRKAKKAVNTEIAFNAIAKEIAKAGKPADACIRLAVEKSWCGFKAEWLENDAARSTRSTCSAPGMERNTRSRSTGTAAAMENMLALGREMFGPQFNNPTYDEQ